MEEINIVEKIQLGLTKIKFCNDFIRETKEERETIIRNFKQETLSLIENNLGINEKQKER